MPDTKRLVNVASLPPDIEIDPAGTLALLRWDDRPRSRESKRCWRGFANRDAENRLEIS